MLSGRFQHNMDKKGRVFIPAKLREELGDKVVLCQSIDANNCLCIYTIDEFKELLWAIQQNKMVIRNKLLRYLSGSVEVEYDSQGRVNVPPYLREFAHLSDEEPVMIIGTDDKIEIWNKPDWDELYAEVSADDLKALLDEAEL